MLDNDRQIVFQEDFSRTSAVIRNAPWMYNFSVCYTILYCQLRKIALLHVHDNISWKNRVLKILLLLTSMCLQIFAWSRVAGANFFNVGFKVEFQTKYGQGNEFHGEWPYYSGNQSCSACYYPIAFSIIVCLLKFWPIIAWLSSEHLCLTNVRQMVLNWL